MSQYNHLKIIFKIGTLSIILLSSQLALAAVCDEEAMPSAHPFSAGEGTQANPYVLCSAQQFNEIGTTYADKHFILGADINFTDPYSDKFIMIGSQTAPFTGSFNGNAHALQNIRLVSPEALDNRQQIGVFRYTRGATIKNLTVEIQIGTTQNGIGDEGGGLVGHAETTLIDNIVMVVNLQGGDRSGGIVGNLLNSQLSNAKVSGTIEVKAGNDSIGGAVGRVDNSTVEAVQANVHLTGINDPGISAVGGLVGRMRARGKVCNAYYEGNIKIDVLPAEQFSPETRLGGLVGVMIFSKISHSYFNGTIEPDSEHIGVITLTSVNDQGSKSVFWNQTREANTYSTIGTGIPYSKLRNKRFMKSVGFIESRWVFNTDEFPTLKYVNIADLECPNSMVLPH